MEKYCFKRKTISQYIIRKSVTRRIVNCYRKRIRVHRVFFHVWLISFSPRRRVTGAERDVDARLEAAAPVVQQVRLPGRGRPVHAAGQGHHGPGRRRVRVPRVQPLRVGGHGEDGPRGRPPLVVAVVRAEGRETGHDRVATGRPAERGRRRRHHRHAQGGWRAET